jgi:hypothetical protein
LVAERSIIERDDIKRSGGSSNDFGLVMTETLTVLIPHSLGKEEALRRLKSGIDQAASRFKSAFTVQEETWNDNQLQFRVRALGQGVQGRVDVEETQVKLDVELPWLIARLAKNIQRVVQTQGVGILDKK